MRGKHNINLCVFEIFSSMPAKIIVLMRDLRLCKTMSDSADFREDPGPRGILPQLCDQQEQPPSFHNTESPQGKVARTRTILHILGPGYSNGLKVYCLHVFQIFAENLNGRDSVCLYTENVKTYCIG